MEKPKCETEAEWLYEHREEIKRQWKPFRDENGNKMTRAQILKRELKKRPVAKSD